MRIVHFNIAPMDLKRIEEMIRQSDAITTIWPDGLFDRYFLGAYVKETQIEGNRFFALFDRNIYTDIIAVAESRGTKSLSEQQKNACALLAFLQLAEVTIEPNQAISEYVDSGHYGEAVDELRLFRAVDNLDPRTLIELALGRKHGIPGDLLVRAGVELVEPKKGEDFLRWRLHYGCALKLAIIDRQGGKPVEKVERFIEWIYKEFMFISTGVVFGLMWLSNKRPAGMLKNIGSSDKTKILRGLRNSTWDMTVVHYWSRQALAEKVNGMFWLLCTADKALKTLARSLLVTNESPDELEQKTRLLFCTYLGETEGSQMYDKYVHMKKHRSDSSRRAHKLNHASELYPVIDELEKELLSKVRRGTKASV